MYSLSVCWGVCVCVIRLVDEQGFFHQNSLFKNGKRQKQGNPHDKGSIVSFLRSVYGQGFGAPFNNRSLSCLPEYKNSGDFDQVHTVEQSGHLFFHMTNKHNDYESCKDVDVLENCGR